MKKALILSVLLIAMLMAGIYMGYKLCHRRDTALAAKYFVEGEVHLSNKKYPEAAEYYNRSVALDPDYEPAYLSLSVAYHYLNYSGLEQKANADYETRINK